MRPTRQLVPIAVLALLLAGCGTTPLARVGSATAVRVQSAVIVGTAAPSPYQYGPIDFVTPEIGFVGEPGGSGILHTVDGGQHWAAESLPYGYQVQALDFWSGSRGIAVADKACSSGCQTALLLTQNGGLSWTVTASLVIEPGNGPMGFHLSSLPAQNTAYAVLGRRLYKSTNAGQTWVQLRLPTGSQALTVDAVSGGPLLVGVRLPAAGSSTTDYAVLQSPDGGQSWHQIWHGSSPPLSLSAISSQTWYLMGAPNPDMVSMGGAFGSLYETTDAGKTWTLLQSPQQWTIPALGFPGFQGGAHWANSQVGWIPVASGAGGGQGGLQVTTDGGHHWAEIGTRRTWSLSAADLLSPSDGWIAGSARTATSAPFLLHTTNGGQTWHQVLPGNEPTMALNMVSPLVGFGLGTASNPHAILVTTNGANIWQTIPGPPVTAGQNLSGIAFSSARQGSVLVSSPSTESTQGSMTVYATNNGGQSWTAAGSLTQAGADVYQMTASGHGLIGLQTVSGQALATTSDGGQHFQLSPFDPKPPTQWIPDLSGSGRVYVLWSRPPHNQLNKPHWTPENLGLDALDPADGKVTPIYTWPNPHGLLAYQPVAIDMLSHGVGFVVENQLERTTHIVQKPVGNGTTRPVPMRIFRLMLWRTKNGGHRWTAIDLPSLLSPVTSSVSFVNSTTGFVLTVGGIYITQDGGLQWTRLGPS